MDVFVITLCTFLNAVMTWFVASTVYKFNKDNHYKEEDS